MADFTEAAATELALRKSLSRRSHPDHHNHHDHQVDIEGTPPKVSISGTGTMASSSSSTIMELELEGQENPYEWAYARRLAITLCMCFHTLAVTMGSSVFTPGLIEMRKDLGMGELAGYAALSVYVCGMALGPVIFAPMSGE